MAKFEVVEVLEDGTTKSIAGLMSFDDGKTAAHYAQQHSLQHGIKCQPRRIEDENGGHTQDWLVPLPFWPLVEADERTRFKKYQIQWRKPMYDPRQGVVRYFSSEEHMKLSKSVCMDLESMINTIFDHDEERGYWLIKTAPDYFKDYTIHFTQSAKTIKSIYRKGLSSCMSKDNSCYVGGNPVECYAEGDFQLAYVLTASGQLKARTLVAPSRKIYTRIYGNATIMEAFLKEKGYTKGIGEDWLGLKFSTKYVEGHYREDENDDPDEYHDSGWMAPYVDFWDNATLVEEDNRHWFVMTGNRTHSLCNTTGIAEEYPPYETCQMCNKLVHSTQSISPSYGNMHMCYECRSTIYGRVHGNRIAPEWSERPDWVTRSDGYICDRNNTWSFRQDTVTGEWLAKGTEPTILNQRLTINEAKEKYSEYWDVLGDAYLPSASKVKDRGTVHSEVPIAA